MRVFGRECLQKRAQGSLQIRCAVLMGLALALSATFLHDGKHVSSRFADVITMGITRKGVTASDGILIKGQGLKDLGATAADANVTSAGDAFSASVDDASVGANATGLESCRPEQLIYVYDLPRRFNVGAIMDDCDRIFWWEHPRNACIVYDPRFLGIGPPVTGATANDLAELGSDASVFADTGQHALEIVMHQYLLKLYPCRVLDPERAAAFYVPLFAGFLYQTNYVKYCGREKCPEGPPPIVQLGADFEKALLSMPFLERNGGRDHFLAMGYPTDLGMRKASCCWSNLLNLTYTREMTIMGIEPQWASHHVTVPYPTVLHPVFPSDISAHQALIRSADRPIFASFAGSLDRPMGMTVSRDIRATIARHCDVRPGVCEVLKCKKECSVDTMFRLYLRSEFCLQPPGDSSTRRGVFDAIQAGCIPVIFMPQTVESYTHFLPANLHEYSVFVDWNDVDKERSNLVDVLRNVTDVEKSAKRRVIADLLPRIVYRDVARTLETGTVTVGGTLAVGGSGQGEILGWSSAYEIAIEAALRKMRERRHVE